MPRHATARCRRLLILAIMACCLPAATAAILDHITAPRSAQDLGGTWEWTAVQDPDALPAATAEWRQTAVPGKHLDLFEKPLDVRQKGRVWFRTRFTLSPADSARRVDLACERIADRCLVVLNGVRVGERCEGWSPFTVPLNPAQRAGGNELLLGVTTPEAGGASGRRPMGLDWFYRHFTGIPLPVHVEVHDRVWISAVAIEPRLEGGSRLTTRVSVRNDGDRPAALRLLGNVGTAFAHAPRPVEVAAGATAEIVLEDAWAQPPLWWPHDPQLRHLELRLERGGMVVDALRQRFGFREIHVAGPDMLLNGVRLLQRRDSIIAYQEFANGSNLDPLLNNLRAKGVNGVRLHLGPAMRIARRCDELGLFVSPEAAICQPRGHQVEEEFWPAAERHLDAMVASMRNCPSVIYWCVSNEFGSYFMPTADKVPAGKHDGAWVDAWQAGQIRRLAGLDPTRIAVASGSAELGGWGAHGPAPALNLHYAWQPWKLSDQLPRTADWLVRSLKPWPQVVWDRTKPIMLSEDLYEDYCFKVPHGLSQMAGDAAYDPHGAISAARSAYRMFAAGNYRAGVAVWNPWAVDWGGSKGNLARKLHANGPLMPEHLIAWRGAERSFAGGQVSRRWVDCHHRGFQTLAAPRIRLEVRSGDRVLVDRWTAISLPPGASIDLPMPVELPAVERLLAVEAILTLADGDRVLSRQCEPWTILPGATPVLPAGVCWLGAGAPAGCRSAADPDAALALQPALLVVARQRLDDAQVQRLLAAAASGLHVLWLETPPGSRLPPPLHAEPTFDTGNAFVRAPNDPVCTGLAPGLLTGWRPDCQVCIAAIPKSVLNDWRVLIDVGGPDGLTHAAVVRRAHGAGTLTVCQLAIVSSLAAGEPAAAELLTRLAATPAVPAAPAPLLVLAEASSPARTALARAHVAVRDWTAGAAGVLLVDARSAGADWTTAVASHLASAGTVLVHRPDAAGIATLATRCAIGLRLIPATDRHLLRHGEDPLAEGISNDDLWWEPAKGYYWFEPGKTEGRPPIISGAMECDIPAAVPFTPAGLLAVPAGSGRLVLDTVRWSERLDDQPVRSARYLRRLLINLGADLGLATAPVRTCLDLAPLCTTALAGTDAGGGWPGPGANDLRYFPVNRTGMDPHLRVPAPVEPMPEQIQLAGVPFRITERRGDPARDAIVPATGQVIALPATGRIDRLWLAGGNASWVGDGVKLLAVVWRYADGGSSETLVLGGTHCGPVIERTPMRSGLLGWTGPTPTRDGAVVWVWPMENPEPARPLAGLDLRGLTGTCAVVGATLER